MDALLPSALSCGGGCISCSHLHPRMQHSCACMGSHAKKHMCVRAHTHTLGNNFTVGCGGDPEAQRVGGAGFHPSCLSLTEGRDPGTEWSTTGEPLQRMGHTEKGHSVDPDTPLECRDHSTGQRISSVWRDTLVWRGLLGWCAAAVLGGRPSAAKGRRNRPGQREHERSCSKAPTRHKNSEGGRERGKHTGEEVTVIMSRENRTHEKHHSLIRLCRYVGVTHVQHPTLKGALEQFRLTTEFPKQPMVRGGRAPHRIRNSVPCCCWKGGVRDVLRMEHIHRITA